MSKSGSTFSTAAATPNVKTWRQLAYWRLRHPTAPALVNDGGRA